ncbi:protein WVD2-like 7 [Senna tora]|uniref:Protein WVD2-like 7 n=1 Tax=Senna tora TaxID=362788 RepID=A0A834WSF2_9FABA|nr:protein WVD2-like 7 [Senna tora]
MSETAASNPALQVSVSFGRFENDSLSWEKWSAFSPNKYLEEVEKCATPGSVAQKKVYFEAHYKKIAARKAELLGQEKQTDKVPLRSEDQNSEDLGGIGGTIAGFDVSNDQNSNEGIKQETYSFGEISRTHVDHLEEEAAVSKGYQISAVDGENKLFESGSDSSQVDKPEEEQSLTIQAENVKESSHNMDNEIGKALKIEAKEVNLDHLKQSKVCFMSQIHVTSINKKSDTAKTKKKPVLPTSKPSQISTPRSTRPSSTPTKILASASSARKGNSPSFSGRKNSSSGENKRIANKSLHMSLSLGPSKLDPAPLPTLRKSFIMEKMGDKEIVKRAFKTFQNNVNQPKTFGEDRSSVKTQVPSRGTEPKVQTSMALRKENGRPTKVDSINKIRGNAVRTSTGLKSDIRAEKGKEFPKKIEEKSSVKEAERVRLPSKLKEQKEEEIKKVKHNFKATPLPAFYRGQKVSQSRPEKVGIIH